MFKLRKVILQQRFSPFVASAPTFLLAGVNCLVWGFIKQKKAKMIKIVRGLNSLFPERDIAGFF